MLIIEDKAKAYDNLRQICGYVENGTNQTVEIFQDDATKWWIVRVGDQTFPNENLTESLAEAAAFYAVD